MCKIQMLRALLKQRLNAVVEEIFGLFERTIAEYEEELSRTKGLLCAAGKPRDTAHKADIQQVSLQNQKEVPCEQQEWSSRLGQEEPESPHIKEEDDEVWTGHDAVQLQGLEEASITKFTYTGISVKSEDEAPSSQLHRSQRERNRGAGPLTQHMTTGDDEEHCGGPRANRNLAPLCHSYPDMDNMMSHSSAMDHSGEDKEPLENNKDSKGDMRPHSDNKQFDCSECGKTFGWKQCLNRHMSIHTGEKPFACAFCTKTFSLKSHMKRHMRVHTGENPFSCSYCDKKFRDKYEMIVHVRTHTGEKPFPCSVCSKSFSRKREMMTHMRSHMEEEQFPCSLCPKRFTRKRYVEIHMRTHTGEKPFGCNVCDKRFTYKYQVDKHKCVTSMDAEGTSVLCEESETFSLSNSIQSVSLV
ncbi:zinc finger protein OZF-like [Dunckerocampus dactyliophorus]|uniref:zinc finger protein OZF-like n=1 Tax=Dunckerocampus dactyliophorus TaxID=161453 RepID=UPI002405A201|nr:zinc finger protein OZF-like [Dunckerocampus dactyliophorus]